jgi:hypothetical protein
MDDMNAFERQVAGEFVRRAGPVRPVNAAAIFTAITATRSPKWRFQSMFSATKFVIAGAILALFGGFLLSGVLTQQPSDEPLPPAAASASATAQAEPTDAPTTEPEPTTEVEADDTTLDLLPGVDLVTEEVEPGVYRVVSDGVREISVLPAEDPRYLGGILDTNIAAGPDGSVWLFGIDGFFRLGAEVAHEWDEEPWNYANLGSADIEVGPDGKLWLHHWTLGRVPPPDVTDGGIWSFDGQTWTAQRERKKDEQLHGVEVQPDGTVWTFWSTGSTVGKNKPKPRATAARLGTDGWQNLPGRVRDDHGEIIVADRPGGELWLLSGGRLHRHDGSGWVVERTPKAGGEVRAAVGADGTLWVRLRPECGPGTRGNSSCGGPSDILARYDGAAWEVFRPKDGVPRMGYHYLGSEHFFDVAPDRSIWFNPIGDYEGGGSECDGIANYDGQGLRRYLRDHCIVAMDMAPDGTVWLRATQLLPDRYSPPDQGSMEWVPTDLFHTYVITPEAVAE